MPVQVFLLQDLVPEFFHFLLDFLAFLHGLHQLFLDGFAVFLLHGLELFDAGHGEDHDVGPGGFAAVDPVVVEHLEIVGYLISGLEVQPVEVEEMVVAYVFSFRFLDFGGHQVAVPPVTADAVVEGEAQQPVVVGGFADEVLELQVGAVVEFFGLDDGVQVGNYCD